MQPRTLKVALVGFPYGGNGGISSEHPDIRHWFTRVSLEAERDPRIEAVYSWDLSDTPITMTRNRAVLEAKQRGIDVLIMFDSDMGPDAHLISNPRHHRHVNRHAQPFFKTAMDFIYDNYDAGPRCIAAPYCGPPPNECVYVFQWVADETDGQDVPHKLSMVSREQAAMCSGIAEAAALPTGLIAFDMRLFDYLEQPYFFYEYEEDGDKCQSCGCRKPGPQARKASTEDVVLTRDLQMHAQLQLGYNPIHVAWDCWAVHHKSKAVGMPRPISVSEVSQKYADAVHRGHQKEDRLLVLPMRSERPAFNGAS